MTRGKIRGFSLLELLVGLGLLIILLGLSFYRFKSTGGDSKAAANIMAAELKAARQLARSSNEPVAVAFPTTPDSVPHATGFLIFQGWTQPRPHRGFSLQADA
ncbi:MAG: prepilin-type N-terminal cleavage/methylation domain-containing protein, partial [Vulcanimicrobiota bacterium]